MSDILRCIDCPKTYESFPLDVSLSEEQWAAINPKLGGVLCANCIVARAQKLHGAVYVRATILDANDMPLNCDTKSELPRSGTGADRPRG